MSNPSRKLHVSVTRKCRWSVLGYMTTLYQQERCFVVELDNRMVMMGHDMGQAVSRQPVNTWGSGSRPSHVYVGFMVDRVALRQVFLWIIRFSLSV
jgi:hypothetical protein